jgi:hypothetical protein
MILVAVLVLLIIVAGVLTGRLDPIAALVALVALVVLWALIHGRLPGT